MDEEFKKQLAKDWEKFDEKIGYGKDCIWFETCRFFSYCCQKTAAKVQDSFKNGLYTLNR